MTDREETAGTIQLYDLDALKINRSDAPKLLVPKHSIQYMFKAEDKK